jgi:glycosyltransferase involved in cell wall biosynthesis
MKQKVLFLANDITYFLSHRLPVAKAAQIAGYDIHVAAPFAGGWERIVSEAFSYHPIHMNRWGSQPLKELRSLWSVYQLFCRLKPDLVHMVTIKPVIYGGVMARVTGVQALVSSVSGLGFVFIRHGLLADITRYGASLAYRSALSHPHSRVIFQNPDDRMEFINRCLVAESKTVLIKGSGVDVNLFNVSPEPPGKITVVFPSRMLWDKGLCEYVEAARILHHEGVDARMVLVGNEEPGNPASASASQLRDWHDSGAIEWWGYREDMVAVLHGASIVCLPSYREGVPKALIEAAACGLPIVTTDVPGCREIVRHGFNGLLVPPRDSKSLAAALKCLIEDRELRLELGRHGRELAVAEFSVDQVVRKTLTVYHELLG